jgi:hypothetical protein
MTKLRTLLVTLAVVAGLALTGCSHKSDTVSKNLSKDADSFKVFRQIVVYNGITDKYILEVDGFCALGNDDPSNEVSYTCKTPDGYIKDIIEKSDNTFVFVHQLHPTQVSDTYFKVIVRPESVLLDVSLRQPPFAGTPPPSPPVPQPFVPT